MRHLIIPVTHPEVTVAKTLLQDLLAGLPLWAEGNAELRRAHLEKLLPPIRDHERFHRAVSELDRISSWILREIMPYLQAEGYHYPTLPSLILLRTLPDAWVVGLTEESQ